MSSVSPREEAVWAAARAIGHGEVVELDLLDARLAVEAAEPFLRVEHRKEWEEELLSDRICDRILDELVVAAGGKRGWTDPRVPFARWDMAAALRAALSGGVSRDR